MSSNAANPKIVISAEDATGAAFGALRNRLSQAEQGATSLISTFSAIAPAFGAALSVAGFASFVKGAINALDALNDVADATGSTIENISALEDVAARTGTSMDTVSTALVKFNKSLADADGKNGVSQALRAIGLDAQALKQLDPAEALLQTAVALQGFADDGNKARLVQELFGKSIKEVAPLLNDLANAGKLNATVTEEQAKQAERLNQQLYEFEKNAQDAGRTIASQLIPSLTNLTRELNAGLQTFGGFGKALVSLGTEGAGAPVERLQLYQKRLGELRDAMDRVRQEQPNGFTKQFLTESAQIEASYQRYIKYYQTVLGLNSQAGAGRGSINPSSDKRTVGELGSLGGGGKSGSAPDLVAQYAKSLEDAQIATLDLTAAERLRVDIGLGRLGPVTERQIAQLEALAEGLDQLKEKTVKLPVGPEVDSDQIAQWREIKSLLGATTTAQLADINAMIDKLSRPESLGINPEQAAEAQRALEQRRRDLRMRSGLATFGEGMDDAATRWWANFSNEAERGAALFTNSFKGMEDAVVQWAKKGKFSAANFFGTMAEEYIRQTLRMAQAKLFFDKSGNFVGLSGIANTLSGFFGFPHKDGLDYVPYDGYPAILHQGERVLTAAEAKGSNSNPAPVINVGQGQVIHIGQGVSRAEVYAAVQQANAANRAAIMRSLKHQGVTA